MLLWGGFAYLAFLVPKPLNEAMSAQLRPWAKLIAIILLCAALASLPIAAASFGEGWADAFNAENLRNILFETPSGIAWILQILGCLMAGGALVFKAHLGSMALALAGALILAGRSFIGHGVMGEGTVGLFLQSNYLLHLLATGAWIGALLPFILIVAKSGAPEQRPLALRAIENFSNFGIGCVVLIIGTGTINTALISGNWPQTGGEGYSTWLFVKLIIVAVMVGLAMINRFTLFPKMDTAWPTHHKSLAMAASFELLLGMSILIIANIFSTLNPH